MGWRSIGWSRARTRKTHRRAERCIPPGAESGLSACGSRCELGAGPRGEECTCRRLRFLPVEHEGNRTHAPEEAEAVAAEIARLVGTPYRDGDGERELRHEDVIVVAPYNAQVRGLREKLPQEVAVGTVDKFQGQQAPVVFYAMASSSSEDVPRGLDFLFSRNRLNVAISRAQCLAYLVCSSRLLVANCQTPSRCGWRRPVPSRRAGRGCIRRPPPFLKPAVTLGDC